MYWVVADYPSLQDAMLAASAWTKKEFLDPESPWYLKEGRFYSAAEWLNGGIVTVEFYDD